MLTKNFLNSLSTSEVSVLMAIFESKYIEKPENLSLLKSSFFVLTLRDCLGKLPKEGFNRWRVLIESVLKKLS